MANVILLCACIKDYITDNMDIEFKPIHFYSGADDSLRSPIDDLVLELRSLNKQPVKLVIHEDSVVCYWKHKYALQRPQEQLKQLSISSPTFFQDICYCIGVCFNRERGDCSGCLL